MFEFVIFSLRIWKWLKPSDLEIDMQLSVCQPRSRIEIFYFLVWNFSCWTFKVRSTTGCRYMLHMKNTDIFWMVKRFSVPYGGLFIFSLNTLHSMRLLLRLRLLKKNSDESEKFFRSMFIAEKWKSIWKQILCSTQMNRTREEKGKNRYEIHDDRIHGADIPPLFDIESWKLCVIIGRQ